MVFYFSYSLAIVIRAQNVEGVKLYFKSNNENCKNPGFFASVFKKIKEGETNIPANLTEFDEWIFIEFALYQVFKPVFGQLDLIYDYIVDAADGDELVLNSLNELWNPLKNFRIFFDLLVKDYYGHSEIFLDRKNMLTPRMIFAK